MSRFVHVTLVTALLALSPTVAPAQIYPLTNGPNGTGTNAVDSAKGFVGNNAVAPERELLYFPQRAGNAATDLGVGPSSDAMSAYGAASARGHERHRRRHARS